MLAARPDRHAGATTRDPLARRGSARRALVIGVVLAVVIATPVAAAPTAKPQSAGAATAATTTQPDIVLILTDDQRCDTLWAMLTVESQLVAKGIEFTNGFVSNPLCCPSGSSILTGEYSHSTGVYTNQPDQPHGGFPTFHDDSTIATWLQGAGYRTGLFGKYLDACAGTYVPSGWTRWFVTYDEGGYYDYMASANGSIIKFLVQLCHPRPPGFSFSFR
jgi:N-acetylglucosamine-6-sulfatase